MPVSHTFSVSVEKRYFTSHEVARMTGLTPSGVRARARKLSIPNNPHCTRKFTARQVGQILNLEEPKRPYFRKKMEYHTQEIGQLGI